MSSCTLTCQASYPNLSIDFLFASLAKMTFVNRYIGLPLSKGLFIASHCFYLPCLNLQAVHFNTYTSTFIPDLSDIMLTEFLG